MTHTLKEIVIFLGTAGAASAVFAGGYELIKESIYEHIYQRRLYNYLRNQPEVLDFPNLFPQKPLFRNALKKTVREVKDEFFPREKFVC